MMMIMMTTVGDNDDDVDVLTSQWARTVHSVLSCYSPVAHFITALHGMQTRSNDENSVRPSVRLSVTGVLCEKMVERSVEIYIPYERSFSLVFWEEEWLVGATPCTWNFGSSGPRWSTFADFQPIIARSASAVTPSEKSSIDANRKSTRRFPMSLRWSSYVAPKSQKGVSKTQNGRFL